jgi:NAD(P)-dependent dehydrogenase (short-subunit alcohol dehydrogenase family)
VALVTGTARGIGRAIAAHHEADGTAVLTVDLEPAPHGPGEPVAADLTTRDGTSKLGRFLVEDFKQ